MGSGSTKTHESFTVTPTTTPADAVPTGGSEPPAAPESEAEDKAWAAINAVNDSPYADGDPAAAYETFAANVASAVSAIEGWEMEDPDAQALDAAKDVLHWATEAWLGHHDENQLAAMASSQGFVHPTLAGVDQDEPSPLVGWLDPQADPHWKAELETKAAERYDLLAAGGSINGLTLADVQAAEAALPNPEGATGSVTPAPWGSWEATPAQVVAAQTAVSDALASLPKDPYHATEDYAAQIKAVLDAENRLATASCPELGEDLPAAVASARHAVTQALSSHEINDPEPKAALASLLNGASDAGVLPADTAKVVSCPEAFALLRASTPQAQRDALLATVADRQATVAKVEESWSTLAAHYPVDHQPPELPTLSAASVETVAKFVKAAGHLHSDETAKAAGWAKEAVSSPSVALTNPVGSPTQLTQDFGAWAVKQPLHLQPVASSLGLEHADHASSWQAQAWLASHWDPDLNKDAIASQVAAKAAPKPTPPPAPKPSTQVAATPATVSATSVSGVSSAGSWAAKHRALISALKHHAASVSGLPDRHPASEVANWTFTPAPASPSLGGAHTKSVHVAPDGSNWMFKPDKTAGGARAQAEAAASSIFARVGVPAVPVYAREVGGKPGSIQPLLSGTTNVSSNPANWSQADVDAMVRFHVAAWAVGDHDGKADNILRTSGGGLVPVDQGQAFKFWGKDKLDVTYHPNSSHGVSPPVFHQAYQAAKAGKLAPGVKIRPEAALGVIQAFEGISDAEYRGFLHDTAHNGAGHSGTAWAPTMRQHAAKTAGKTTSTVTTGEVAQAFLDHAVDRKNNLRASFAAFFGSVGIPGGDKLLKVT